MTQFTAQTTQLSSLAQFSTPLQLDPLSKMTSVQISVTTPSSGTGQLSTAYVQMTNDVNVFGSAIPTPFPQPQPVWSQVGSSAYATLTSSVTAGVINSSQNVGYSTFDNAAMFVLLQNVGGLRLASSAAGGVIGLVTLKALQSPTA